MYGALAGMGGDISLEEIARVRRETWGELAGDK
jgi:hypothetical protein